MAAVYLCHSRLVFSRIHKLNGTPVWQNTFIIRNIVVELFMIWFTQMFYAPTELSLHKSQLIYVSWYWLVPVQFRASTKGHDGFTCCHPRQPGLFLVHPSPGGSRTRSRTSRENYTEGRPNLKTHKTFLEAVETWLQPLDHVAQDRDLLARTPELMFKTRDYRISSMHSYESTILNLRIGRKSYCIS